MMRFVVAIVIVLAGSRASTAGEPLLEFTVGEESYVGCAVAHNDKVCWLAHDDGRLSEVSLDSVTAFRKVSDEFHGLTPLEARNELRGELGRGWQVVGTGHYLVCATTDTGKAHAQHFEDLYRSFRSYFTRRGFVLPEPEFPLIAIVFANRADFAKQCRKDGVPPVAGLRGYYHRTTNRINLFEEGQQATLPMPLNRTGLAGLDRADSIDVVSMAAVAKPTVTTSPGALPPSVDANIEGSLKDTIVHEATHQLAFNLGLHSRIGHPPKWVVEGLATMFEAEGTRANTGGKHPRGRVNEERFWWFNMYREKRREPGSLAEFVASDDAFRRNVLDFYSQAWALTFFLAETRPHEYADYLKTISQRDPLTEYTDRERLDDFLTAFGDLDRLEVEMLRFIDDLN